MLGQDEVWERILNFARSNEGKAVALLNPSKGSPFTITEVSENYIRINKLPIKMTKNMFLDIYDYLKSRRGWVEIGARRVGASPDTVEGFIKMKFFNGNVDALSTATWFAAILVYSNIGIEFNHKAKGQKIRFKI
uniref:Uncharacterized protein n=1 Tax=candidate division WOR-3 bacterium TaxID=2052148 RepID=A0A7C2P194_UNCW3